MTSTITKPDSSQREAETAPQLFDDWFDPIETEVRDRARQFIEELIRGELDMVLERPRYGRGKMAEREGSAGVTGHRHGSRTRSLTGTAGQDCRRWTNSGAIYNPSKGFVAGPKGTGTSVQVSNGSGTRFKILPRISSF